MILDITRYPLHSTFNLFALPMFHWRNILARRIPTLPLSTQGIIPAHSVMPFKNLPKWADHTTLWAETRNPMWAKHEISQIFSTSRKIPHNFSRTNPRKRFYAASTPGIATKKLKETPPTWLQRCTYRAGWIRTGNWGLPNRVLRFYYLDVRTKFDAQRATCGLRSRRSGRAAFQITSNLQTSIPYAPRSLLQIHM